MHVPAVVVPVASRSHLAVLQYLCDDLARKRPSLGHIFSALRSEITRLGEIISTATPAEVATGKPGRHAVWIETLPDRCIHGLRRNCLHCDCPPHVDHLRGYVPSRLFVGTMIRTPENGVTCYDRPCLYKEFPLRPIRMEADGKMPCRYDSRLDGLDDLEPAVDESFDSAGRRFRTSTCVILPVEDFCAACEAAKPKQAEVSKAATPLQPKIDERPMPYPDAPVDGRSWEEARATRVAAVKKQTLAEYGALHAFLRHQNGEGAAQPRCFTNWCYDCKEYVEKDHGCKEWQGKRELAAKKQAAMMLAERQAAAKKQAARRERTTQNVQRALIEQGLWVGDYLSLTYDSNNVEEREAMVTKFDRDLSRKGNKYRIQ
jgi:hypothetical protein